ncbi:MULTISPECIES: hypothetical protein [Rufibacter]|uniref:Uncharacterized protein n=1 Tax=Rufibacter quisquiliarum TaxID=1549639 RepID=A0A839H0E9_9BACT|nr:MULTISPECIES: hypothetical protein [Rufibacter]MBA9079401.1 hypothetical protein [Rufibacter quisquiliarum]
MKTISTLSSLLVIGALGILASTWLSTPDLSIDLSDEETHLYL